MKLQLEVDNKQVEIELHYDRGMGQSLSVKVDGEFVVSVNPKAWSVLVNKKSAFTLED